MSVVLFVVFVMALLLGPASPAAAVDQLTAELATAAVGNAQISIHAPFSGDDNGDGTLLLQWALEGSDWNDPGALLGTETLDPAAGSFDYTINGLQNRTYYQVRMTYQDPDGVDGEPALQELNALKPINPLLHNSETLGSTKWAGDNGWGVPGGKYGEFSCQTCHIKQTPNIKRIKESLVVTDSGSFDQFPIEAASGTVQFLSTDSGNADLGDDNRVPGDSSTHICEACHTQTKYHNYDVGNNSDGTDHYNKSDCAGCHSHSEGFKAGCNGCHPNPPPWGSHQAHLSENRLLAPLQCKTCHQTAIHLNTLSEVRFDDGDARVSTASYADGDETSRFTEGGGYAASPAYTSCGNLYCHSNAAPYGGVNSYANPNWGGAAQTCSSCHDGGGALTTLSTRHREHTDTVTYNSAVTSAFDCNRCHTDTVSDSATISDNTLHLDGIKTVAFAEINSVTGTYNSTTLACDNTYCHSDGRGGAPGIAVRWSDSGSLGCTGCHKGRIQDAPGDDTQQMGTKAHHRLASDAWIRQYPCQYCHADTVDAAGLLIDNGRHVDGKRDVVFDPKWSIPGYPAPRYNTTTGACDDLYCHSDGTKGTPEVRDFPWSSTGVAECDSCHGHQGDCATCHGAGYTGWSAEDQWKKATPMYPNGGVADDRANSHIRHLQTDFSCNNCHARTVFGDCKSCHAGGIPTGTMSESGHVDAAYHVNKEKDVFFPGDVGSYDKVAKTCSGTVCHGDNTVTWGDSRNASVMCLDCHGTTGPDVDDFGAFNGTQARISETEWTTTGHGRVTGIYDNANPEIPNNPAANFPGDACWYCHDQNVLHNEEANPYRLKLHEQFSSRFDKECVYCHMEGTDVECLGCHNSPNSLSTQLAAITSPPYSQDHTGYTGGGTSCLTALCHPDDASRHNTHAGTWTPAQQADMRNQYLMAGVCLQCHDNDNNDRCHSCHSWGGDPADDPYQLGYDPGTGFVSGSSKASSTHFGYKHHLAYEDSLAAIVASGTTSEAAATPDVLKDSSGNWADKYQWRGKALKMTGGVNSGEIRPILFNSNDSLTLRVPFDNPVGAGDSYEIIDVEWRGGKFCWDCHDPHGDGNIYMIQDQITVRSDGAFGIPVAREPVTFTEKKRGNYTNSDAMQSYDRICNVCHTETDHYQQAYGDSHRENIICTSCHEHGFGEGHGSGQACNACHENKPSPNHLGFGQPRDCTKCHQGALGLRMNIMDQFKGQSHHVQGTAVTNLHCYQCHWEATDKGLIDVDYHLGYNYITHESVPNAASDLVIMGDGGVRPTTYIEGVTAVTFNSVSLGAAPERPEVLKVSTHCLSCHRDENNDVDFFGDCKTPRQYAWDGTSIAARYNQAGVVKWGGAYVGEANAAQKNIDKAFSAHGNAVANQGGWSVATGEDGALSSTRAGTEPGQNVQCFDCHNSHGSYTTGNTSSYMSFDGSYGGGNLKESKPGKGGYTMQYSAEASTNPVNAMGPGAAQCFDCHETATMDNGTPGNPDDDKPWGHLETFGATAPIQGYWDSSRFAGGANGVKARWAYRAGRTGISGHFNTQSPPLGTAALEPVNGMCTPCHDPHGVSPTLGDNQRYAIPLLKGTWLTSPYKEDSPQDDFPTGYEGPRPYRDYNYVRIDRELFGDLSNRRRIGEDESQFAGLCLRCHAKSSLTDGIDKNTPFKDLDRIHETVKGWGNNAEHNFSCSKCHQAHSSGLPRLMRTNCLDDDHRAGVTSGGVGKQGGSWGKFPTLERASGLECHESSGAAGGAWNAQEWNNLTPWVE